MLRLETGPNWSLRNAVRRRNSATRCGFLTEVAKLLRCLDDGDVLLGSATRFFKSFRCVSTSPRYCARRYLLATNAKSASTVHWRCICTRLSTSPDVMTRADLAQRCGR